MTFGNKFLTMIDMLVKMLEKNLVSQQGNKSGDITGIYRHIKRFIVTNYEIFLDFFKQHSDFIAQKYFNKMALNEATESMIRTSLDKFGGVSIDQTKVSMMTVSKAYVFGMISQNSENDHLGLWIIFDYVEAFSYIAQLAIAKIPLDEKNAGEQKQFREEVLDGLCRVMNKVYDKII